MSEIVNIEYVEVCCLVLPSGKNLWFETSAGDDYLKKVMTKWKNENPEYVNENCTSGAVVINMPKEKYIAIGAQCGGGAFEFPRLAI